jgi:hypothetical protein
LTKIRSGVFKLTNGVHAPTWTDASFAHLFNANFPIGREPGDSAGAEQLCDDDLARVSERT